MLFHIEVSPPTWLEYAIVENTHELELEPNVHQEEPIISLHALSSISSPQTLKLKGLHQA